jgi:enoyl-CoA hydratase/carnithine racemase
VIHWEERGHVGVATIDREERRNALNGELCAEMLRLLQSNPTCRAVVITGRGTAFSAGADLGTRFGDEGTAAEQAHSTTDTFRPIFEHLMEAIDDYTAPVIAAINGPAIGAGLQLAVGCDLRVVARDATLGIPAGRLGVFLSPSNIERLGMLVGQGAAREALVAGAMFTAEEAHLKGLANRVVDDAFAASLEWAEEIAQLAPLTVAGHKRALVLFARA